LKPLLQLHPAMLPLSGTMLIGGSSSSICDYII